MYLCLYVSWIEIASGYDGFLRIVAICLLSLTYTHTHTHAHTHTHTHTYTHTRTHTHTPTQDTWALCCDARYNEMLLHVGGKTRTHTHNNTHTHTHTHTHTQSNTQTFSLSLTLDLSLCLCITFTHTHTHTFNHCACSLFLDLSPPPFFAVFSVYNRLELFLSRSVSLCNPVETSHIDTTHDNNIPHRHPTGQEIVDK